MTKGTYIGQAQLSGQIDDGEFAVGDLVCWKSSDERYYKVLDLTERYGECYAVLDMGESKPPWEVPARWFRREDD